MTDTAQALFDNGLNDYNEKRFEDALVKYRAAAAMGHSRAMNCIGVAFFNGDGVAKDIAEAYTWFKVSAEKGEPRALRNLALGYRTGVPEAGISADHVEAMRLMRMAADAGLPDAMYFVADWLREANENDPVALEWFMKGADTGDVDCMLMVGDLHRTGACGLQPDYSLALPWYERAAAKGDADQISRIANTLEESGDLVRAIELYEKAADRGSTTAMVFLGVCYENGKGVTKSAEKAVELYQRASDLGDATAMSYLGVCYENGDGVAKSVEKAAELYQRATELGDASAMSGLGVCYANGRGVATNFEKGVTLFSRASELGDARATANLGVCYMNGNGVAASIRIGAEFQLRGAALGASNVKQSIDSGLLEWPDEICYCVVTALMSGSAPGSAARNLLEARRLTKRRVSLGAFVFDGDNFPLDRIGDTLRLFAEFDRSIQSLQFALRLGKERPPACSAKQQRWFNRVAELIDGDVVNDGDKTMLTQMAKLLLSDEMPLELYEALKRTCDARVAKLTVKSVLPLVCVLEELDRAVRSLEFSVGSARFAVRACVFGAMCEHLLAAELPSDLTSETALETTLLWLGVVRQAEFFGGVQMERVAVVERAVEARLRNDKAARDKYAMILVRDLKRRVPHLLLATPEFAAASAAKLDGEIENKRVKVILLGDSGVGKTQIRRRLGGVHAFEAKHTSTDTAEVTSVEVTSLTVSSKTRWVERDDTNTSKHTNLFGPTVARSLMSVAAGADNVPHKSSTLSGAREPERASSSSSGDARSVAPTKSASVAATSSDVSTVGVSETIAPAMHADLSTSSARTPAAPSCRRLCRRSSISV
jgi:TPR repeat protein